MDPLSVFHAARRWPDRTFMIEDGAAITFADAARGASAAAARLFAMGASSERPAAFVARATRATVYAVLGALASGVPIALLHARWTDAERASALAPLPEAVVVDPEELQGELGEEPAASSFDGERRAAILFTSGTSASPKGVVLPRRAFVASARAHADNLPFRDGDRWLLAMPLAHAGGLSIVTRALVSGTAFVLHERFDADAVLASIARDRVTLASLVPPMLAALLDRDARGALASLRVVLVGGAGFPVALRARSRAQGVRALATYGMTEACSQIATQRLEDAPGDADSGRPLAGVEVVVDAPERGAPGPIRVRGDVTMLGYLGDRPRSRGAFLDTGDLGAWDEEGRLTVWGRADDTIVTGGENVYPAEVERAIGAQRGVRAVAVFGVPDETWGALVAAALVLEQERAAEEVLSHAAAALAPFKRPRRFVVVPDLSGPGGAKVSRRSLAARWSRDLSPMRYERSR